MIWLLLFSARLFATTIDLSTHPLTSAPINLAAPKVDVVTGTYVENAIDLVVFGSDPLSLRRFYYHTAPTDDTRYGFWHINPEATLFANLEYEPFPKFFSMGQATGGMVQFHASKDSFVPKDQSSLPGQPNPRNTKISYSKVHESSERFLWQGTIKDGTGSIKEFKTGMHEWHKADKTITVKRSHSRSVGTLRVAAWIPYQLQVRKEQKPNGNILVYTYTDWRDGSSYPWPQLIESITLYNHDETKVMAQLNFRYDLYKWKFAQACYGYFGEFLGDYKEVRFDVSDCTITGSDGRTVHYNYKKRNRDIQSVVLTSVTTPTDTQTYDYHDYSLTNLTQNSVPITTTYDAQNRVKSQSSPAGLMASYTYHPNLTEVTDGEGETTRYHFDTHINRIEHPNGIEENKWDPETGNLLSKSIYTLDGHLCRQTTYRYDQSHNPVEETTANHTIYRTYLSDDRFNLLLEERDGSKKTTYTYKPDTNLLRTETIYDDNQLLRQTTHTYDDCATLIETTIQDQYGNQQTTTIIPNETCPNFGLPLKVITADETIAYTYTPFGAIATQTHYDNEGNECYTLENIYDHKERLRTSTNALGQKTYYHYKGNNLTSIQTPQTDQTILYDKANRPTTFINDEVITYKEYDTLGRTIAETDPSGFKTHYIYTPTTLTTLYPDGATHVKEFDPLGNIICETDPNGYQTHTIYDHNSKPLKITYPDGTFETFTYTPSGDLATHLDKNGALTTYTFDALGNQTSAQTGEKYTCATYCLFGKLTEADPMGIVTYYTYDQKGHKISEQTGHREINYTYDTLGRCAKIDSGDIYTIYTYDYLGQTLSEKTNHSYERYTYDFQGNCTSITNSKGTYQTHYNTLGQPIKKINPLGHITTLSYAYKGGFTITETDPSGLKTIQKHDCRNRVVEKIRGDQISTYSYDPSGNPTQTTYNSITHTTTYGPNNRIETSTEAGQKTTTYLYNDKGQLTTLITPNSTLEHLYDTYGRLISYTGPDFSYSYTYDLLDRVTEASDGTKRTYDIYGNLIQEQLANGFILKNTYDLQGRRTKLTLPDLSTIDYTYEGNYLKSIIRNNHTHTYTRDQDGAITTSGSAYYVRDALSRCTTIISPYYTAHATFDTSGNLTHCTSVDPLGPQDAQYAYDKHHQLTHEQNHTYQFDPLYNRIKDNDQTYTYNTLNQNTNYTYDLNGNLLSDDTHTYTYDSLDRLTSVDDETYTYDAFHRRISSDTTNYIWDGKHEIGTPTQLRVLGEGLGAEIGAAILIEINDQTYIPTHNLIGSLATLHNATTLETYRYTAYGVPLTDAQTSPWRFASKRTDPSGLVYFGRRYYIPTQGRWLTPDPTGFQDGPNLYAYAHNQPLTHIDRHGLNALFSYQTPRTFLRLATYPLFKTIELTGRHLIPIAGVRDVIESIGRWGCGGKLIQRCDYRTPNQIYQTGGTEIDGISLVLKNGMLASFQSAKKQAHQISDSHGGANVTLLYNSSHGLIMDLLECGMAKLGIKTPTEKMSAHYFSSQLAKNPNQQFITYAHSQAGTHMANVSKLLTPYERQHITLRTFGSATLVPDSAFGRVTNYISPHDIVPKTNPFRYFRARAGRLSNVEFLEPNSICPIMEHYISGVTYWNRINRLGREFTNEHQL